MRGAVAYLPFRQCRKFSTIPTSTFMFNSFDTETSVNILEVVPSNNPRCEIFTWPYTMEMRIALRKDAMVSNHLLDTVASNNWKCPLTWMNMCWYSYFNSKECPFLPERLCLLLVQCDTINNSNYSYASYSAACYGIFYSYVGRRAYSCAPALRRI